jgi:hypothetical integral membrane protein (TIGR02206 family)
VPLFGRLHLALLGATAAAAVALPWLCRRGVIPARAARLVIGWALLANELGWWAFRYSHEGVHAWNLPLQLCDLTVWLAVLACLTARRGIAEFAYFAGMAGAGMALLTPDLWSPWPTYPAIYFFVAHGGIVIAVTLVAFGGMVRFRPGAVWRSFGWLVAYAAPVGAFNAAFGSNYMYLSRKPASASLLDKLGPWPWYLLPAAAAGLGLFWLLWLPLRAAAADERPPRPRMSARRGRW